MTFATLIEAVAVYFATKEEAHRARIAGSKTNLDYLINVGVVVTEDDARDNAYKAEYLAKQAKAAGVSIAAMTAAEEYADAFTAVLAPVLRAAAEGETETEHAARVEAAIAAMPVTFAPGAKKPCKHNDTKKARGMLWYGSGPDVESGGCCRCGAKVEFPRRPAAPTAAAKEAQAFVAENLQTLKAYVYWFANR